MSEWWTYRLSDLLLFSSRTYYRLFELYNAAIWPAQILAIGLGLMVWFLLARGAATRGRLITAILSGCWLFVAIAFHAQRYATINWAARYFAWGFAFEAALLLGLGTIGGKLSFEKSADGSRRAGVGIFGFALLLEPLIGLVLRRNWRQAEIFGIAPDPTAVATLGVLLIAVGKGRWLLFAVPAIWCAITGATLLTMKAPDCWIPSLVALLAIILASRQARARRRIAATRRLAVS